MSLKKDWDGVIKEGTAIRDLYPDYVEDQQHLRIAGQGYIAKNNKTAAIAELERYVKQGGRSPEFIKLAPSCWTKPATRRKPRRCWTV